MIRRLLLAAILTGCSGLSDEEFYGPNTMPSCWTVDGDPLLYFHVPAGEKMSDEFKQECNAMHRAATGRPTGSPPTSEQSERGME